MFDTQMGNTWLTYKNLNFFMVKKNNFSNNKKKVIEAILRLY